MRRREGRRTAGEGIPRDVVWKKLGLLWILVGGPAAGAGRAGAAPPPRLKNMKNLILLFPSRSKLWKIHKSRDNNEASDTEKVGRASGFAPPPPKPRCGKMTSINF